MCDPFGLIGFATGTVSSIALAAHVRKNLQNIKTELVLQMQDLEILSLMVSKAERGYLTHGRPAEDVTLAMAVCVQRKADFLRSIAWLQEVQVLVDSGAELSPRKRIKRFKVAFFDAHKRDKAFQSFRDSVYLLRSLTEGYGIRYFDEFAVYSRQGISCLC